MEYKDTAFGLMACDLNKTSALHTVIPAPRWPKYQSHLSSSQSQLRCWDATFIMSWSCIKADACLSYTVVSWLEQALLCNKQIHIDFHTVLLPAPTFLTDRQDKVGQIDFQAQTQIEKQFVYQPLLTDSLLFSYTWRIAAEWRFQTLLSIRKMLEVWWGNNWWFAS